ncbi:MAG: hypothetical protein ACI83H_002824 [Glaciecola sp.]|jgi:hypothetical protein
MNKIRINQELKTFLDAETQSTAIGILKVGEYDIIEITNNYLNASTDYIMLTDTEIQKNVWICSRNKETSYASIIQPTLDFNNDEYVIEEEAALTKLLPIFKLFTYDLNKTTYPFQLKGCNLSQSPPALNNCCTFVEALVVKAWEDSIPNFSCNTACHGQMMILSADDYFSPVTCLIEQKMALAVDDDNQAPVPWTVIQGWKKKWSGGHTFIIIDYDPITDRVLTLESNAAYLLNGVGYRMIGSIAKNPKPPKSWAENDSLWTWTRMKKVYNFRKQANLKVKNISWI